MVTGTLLLSSYGRSELRSRIKSSGPPEGWDICRAYADQLEYLSIMNNGAMKSR